MNADRLAELNDVDAWHEGDLYQAEELIAEVNRLTAEVSRLGLLALKKDNDATESRITAKQWRARAEVKSRDVEAAGVTLAQCEAWLTRDGWTLGSHPDNEHRVWQKPGVANVNLSPNTPSWTYCIATGIAVTIQIRAGELGRPEFDILEEMAAMEVSR